VSHPVSGSDIALATPNDVMTHVPWSGDTARSPAIAGIDTFAIDVSSTFMNVASESAIVPSASVAPERAGAPFDGTGGAAGVLAGSVSFSAVMR
jgi:hypothetical protein